MIDREHVFGLRNEAGRVPRILRGRAGRLSRGSTTVVVGLDVPEDRGMTLGGGELQGVG